MSHSVSSHHVHHIAPHHVHHSSNHHHHHNASTNSPPILPNAIGTVNGGTSKGKNSAKKSKRRHLWGFSGKKGKVEGEGRKADTENDTKESENDAIGTKRLSTVNLFNLSISMAGAQIAWTVELGCVFKLTECIRALRGIELIL